MRNSALVVFVDAPESASGVSCSDVSSRLTSGSVAAFSSSATARVCSGSSIALAVVDEDTFTVKLRSTQALNRTTPACTRTTLACRTMCALRDWLVSGEAGLRSGGSGAREQQSSALREMHSASFGLETLPIRSTTPNKHLQTSGF